MLYTNYDCDRTVREVRQLLCCRLREHAWRDCTYRRLLSCNCKRRGDVERRNVQRRFASLCNSSDTEQRDKPETARKSRLDDLREGHIECTQGNRQNPECNFRRLAKCVSVRPLERTEWELHDYVQ